MTMVSQAKSFVPGVVLGVVFGVTVVGAVAHLVLIGFALAGLGVAAYHGRRLLLRRARCRQAPEGLRPGERLTH